MVKQNTGGCSYERSYRYYFRKRRRRQNDNLSERRHRDLPCLGKRVVLIDTDIGLRNLDVVMGLENRIVYNLVDVIEGNCRMKQALIRDKRYPDLFLSTFRPDAGQVVRESGADDKISRRLKRRV